jgi:hypothetical protein
MKKYLVLLLALFMVFVIHSQGQCAVVPADGDQLSTVDFRIDSSGGVYHKALIEVVSTNDTITAAESGKVFLINGDTVNEVLMTLPAADTGLVYTFVSVNSNAQKFEINPNGTDQLVFSTSAAGNRIVSPGNISDAVQVVSSDDTIWAVIPLVGTFTVKAD